MTHTADNAFACDQFDCITSQSRILATYKKRHCGEKAFKCDQCTFQTRHSMAPIKHKRRHSLEEPLKTVFDHKKVNSDKETRAKKISALKLLKCSFCDYKFSYE